MSVMHHVSTYLRTLPVVVFSGHHRIAHGVLADAALAAKAVLDSGSVAPILIFELETGQPVDLDFRGTVADVLARLAHPPPRSSGRPKLGVTAREVTLLPRHWDWLAGQPGGASVALRKLVDAARSQVDGHGNGSGRAAQEAAYRFMSAMAGDLPRFEDAARALFAHDRTGFVDLASHWPRDICEHACAMAEPTWPRATA